MERDDRFLGKTKLYYLNNNLPLPDCAPGELLNAHHIKPIAFGGTNIIGGPNNNAVLLCASDHQPYTTWWGRPDVGPFIPS